jgi:hypothetical protein
MTERVDQLIPLKDIRELLSAHPNFRVVSVRRNPGRNRAAAMMGWMIKNLGLLKFGAEFDRNFTLLSFHVNRHGQRRIVLQLCWHAIEVPAGWSTFIHFVDERGAIQFQGDYSFEGQVPNAFGMLYSRRSIEVPAEVPAGIYRVRLGIWSPSAAAHLPLTRFHGCFRESAEWCRNAVLLKPFKL